MSRYLFKSARLGFRNWQTGDLGPMAAINANPEVMKYFPAIQDRSTTAGFIQRMQEQFKKRGYSYFAVELLATQTFTGFIGLSYQDFTSPWSPFTDIGWRLDTRYWGLGLATEGALRMLEFAFNETTLTEVYAIAPTINQPSINVIKKIGMQKIGEFEHPELLNTPWLKLCEIYSLNLKNR